VDLYFVAYGCFRRGRAPRSSSPPQYNPEPRRDGLIRFRQLAAGMHAQTGGLRNAAGGVR